MQKTVTINQLAVSQERPGTVQPLPAGRGRRPVQSRGSATQSAERARQHIKALTLVRLLHRVADGSKAVEPHQVTAAVALLRKVMPDLQATLIGGDPALPITIVTRMLNDDE